MTGPRGRALRRNWTRTDTLGALVLLVGAIMLFNRVVLDQSYEWCTPRPYFRGSMIHLGLTSVSALAIGLGLLPLIAGLVSLRPARPARRSDLPRFRCVPGHLDHLRLAVCRHEGRLPVDALLDADRGAEPVLPLAAPARRDHARAGIPPADALGPRSPPSAFVLWIVLKEPYQLGPYYEAPGLLDPDDLQHALELGSVPSALGALHGLRDRPGAARRRARFRWLKAVTVVLLLGWLLAGEIQATDGNVQFADALRNASPTHLNWVDQRTHGQGVTYLYANATDNNGLWLTEFWNRDLKHVDSLDGSAPGPGPVGGPSLLSSGRDAVGGHRHALRAREQRRPRSRRRDRELRPDDPLSRPRDMEAA